MCGIAGFAGAGDAADLRRMCARIAHRGPDDEDVWSDASAARPLHLGFRRLVVLDRDGGRQPMRTADDRLVVVFNGEIYNFAELRRELEAAGHRFASDHSDTEVLLHGYRAWGEALVPRLSGMFAFAIYDRERQSLFCARDRFGKKPFFYAATPRAFVFASEASAVLAHPAVTGGIDPRGLERYFALGFIPAPETLHRGVAKLPGGHTLRHDLRTGETRVATYWRYRIRVDATPPGGPEDWAAEVRHLLDAAVRRRLRSDVPLGLFLSGGIDSTSVAALAAAHQSGLRACSIGFAEPSYDESAFAALAAREFGLDHEIRRLDLAAAADRAPALFAAMDEPIADPSLLPTWMLSGVARERLTVALAGDGGDELFAGYDTFPVLRPLAAYARLAPAAATRALRALAARMPRSDANLSLDLKVRRALRGLDHAPAYWHPLWLAPAGPDELAALFGRRIAPEDVYADIAADWNACESPDLVDRALEFYGRYYLAAGLLTKIDRASMLHGLEVREPFLDNDLVDYAVRLPHAVKLHGRSRKWVLKRAMRDRIPAAITRRRKKGFGIPVPAWLRHFPAPDAARADAIGLDGRRLRRWWEEHRAGRADHRGVLWAWYALDGCLGGRVRDEAA